MSKEVVAYILGFYAAVGACWVWINIAYPQRCGPDDLSSHDRGA